MLYKLKQAKPLGATFSVEVEGYAIKLVGLPGLDDTWMFACRYKEQTHIEVCWVSLLGGYTDEQRNIVLGELAAWKELKQKGLFTWQDDAPFSSMCWLVVPRFEPEEVQQFLAEVLGVEVLVESLNEVKRQRELKRAQTA